MSLVQKDASMLDAFGKVCPCAAMPLQRHAAAPLRRSPAPARSWAGDGRRWLRRRGCGRSGTRLRSYSVWNVVLRLWLLVLGGSRDGMPLCLLWREGVGFGY